MIDKIKNIANELEYKLKRPIKLMEVCGSHTETIAKYGINKIIPESIKLVSGPGCPVCVTSKEDIDSVIALSDSGIPIATYGDMLKVPGSSECLEDANRRNRNIFTIYSSEELMELPENTVFFAIGFETTTPMTAYALKKGKTTYCCHKTMPQIMEILVNDPEIEIDGFINPGHVSAMIGLNAYKNIHAAQVVAGFEAEDVLEAIFMLCKQILNDEKRVENQYKRLVTDKGNIESQEIIMKYFNKSDANWRGLGGFKDTGLEIKDDFKDINARYKYAEIIKEKVDTSKESKLNQGCICGNIIKGKAAPADCPLFKAVCTPDSPIGPCMVGREGSCNVSFRYKSA